MSKKTFSTAPKPKNKQLSPEAITAFEQGGAGHDTATRAVSVASKKAGQGRAVAKSKKPAPASVAVVETAKKRLSLDLPENIHQRFKTACSATSRKMTLEVMEFIERRTAELESEAGYP